MSDCEIAKERETRDSRLVGTSRSVSRSRSRDNNNTEKKSRRYVDEQRPSSRRRSPSHSRSRSRSPRSVSDASGHQSPRQRYNGTRDNPKPSRCLGVFGISLYTKERDLKDMFRKCGTIEECTIVYDRRTGRSRGFGFVRFKHQEDADEARELMNGKEFDSRKIRVDYSVTQRPHSPTPGMYMGKSRETSRSSRYDDRRDRRRRSRSRSYRSRSRSRDRDRDRDRDRRR